MQKQAESQSMQDRGDLCKRMVNMRIGCWPALNRVTFPLNSFMLRNEKAQRLEILQLL